MSFKLFLPCAFGAVALLFSACKKLDQPLMTKVETEIAARQSAVNHFESVGVSLEKFQKELETTFPSQENEPADSLKIRANMLVNKERSALSEYKQGLLDLTNRLAEYRAGTAKKEDLEKVYAVESKGTSNMKQTFDFLEVQDVNMRLVFDQRLKERKK